jgi:ABC-2 type transport system permease protein
MPLYFLSGGMFPVATAPRWMKSLMVVNPLTYGVDAIRNVVFSGTMVTLGAVQKPLVEIARAAGLIRWDLALDTGIMAAVAVLLGGLAAWSFSMAN